MKKLHERLKELRKDTGHTQETFAADFGFSTPGYVKLENGQRLPDDDVVDRIVNTVSVHCSLNVKNALVLKDELLTLKGMASTSQHVRKMATYYAQTAPWNKSKPQITPPRRRTAKA